MRVVTTVLTRYTSNLGLLPFLAPVQIARLHSSDCVLYDRTAMSSTIVGVMGPGETANHEDITAARRLGELIAQQGWVTLTGGRAVGVMEAALEGAKHAGGLTVGVLPHENAEQASSAADIRIVTGMGAARNLVNVLSSSVVFVCGLSTGTASEVALALKTKRPTILLNATSDAARFWQSLDESLVRVAKDPEHAIALAQDILKK